MMNLIKPNIRIVVIDDHPVFRDGLVQLLAGTPELQVVGTGCTATDAIALVQRHAPHIVVLDLKLPGCGIEAAKRITQQFAQVRTIMLTASDSDDDVSLALQAGASGYVNKQEDPDKLLEAIRGVLNGRSYFTAEVLDRMTGRSTDGTSKPFAGSVKTLTDRELQVFELIGEGLTTRAIASRLDLSMHTIDTHREKIKAKLKLKNAAELARHAVQWNLERG
jgi:DNA-binding NarL/FixJ family response regulator